MDHLKKFYYCIIVFFLLSMMTDAFSASSEQRLEKKNSRILRTIASDQERPYENELKWAGYLLILGLPIVIGGILTKRGGFRRLK